MSDVPEQPHAPDPEVGLESNEDLLERFSRTRDVDLREELAVRYLPLAQKLAGRYRNRGEQLDDLQQVARLGLLKALDGFDSLKGAPFEAYASPTILGELRRHFRDKQWSLRIPRELKEAIPKIRIAIEDLAGEEGRMPDTEEIAERVDMDESEVLDAIAASEAARVRSLDAPAPGAEPGEGALELGEKVGAVDEMLEQTEYGVMLEERLEALTDREREVVYQRFALDLTQTEIGESIGVSQMQVSRILADALGKLRGG